MSDKNDDAEPSREIGTCPGCTQIINLRPAMGDAPYPALLVTHRTKDDRERPMWCDESDRVPGEWRAYLEADPERWATYNAAFRAWASRHGM